MNPTRAAFARVAAVLPWLALCAALMLLLPQAVRAQGPLPGASGAGVSEQATPRADPYGRDSPRSLVVALVAAFASGDAERVTHCLESPSGASADDQASLARRLRIAAAVLPCRTMPPA